MPPLGACETRSVVFTSVAVTVGVASLCDAAVRRVPMVVIKFRFFSLMFTSMSLLSAIYEQQPERAVLHGWFNMMGFAVAGLCANLYFLEVFVPMYSASAFERFDRSQEEYGWLFRWYSKSRIVIVAVTFILAFIFSALPNNTVYLVYNILSGVATFFFAFTAALIVLRLGYNVRKHRIASQRAEKDNAMFASKERAKNMRTIEIQLYLVSFVIGAFAFVSTLFGSLHSVELSAMLSERYVNIPCSLPNAITESVISICAILITRSPAAKPRKWASKYIPHSKFPSNQKFRTSTETDTQQSKRSTNYSQNECQVSSLEGGLDSTELNTMHTSTTGTDGTDGRNSMHHIDNEPSMSRDMQQPHMHGHPQSQSV